MITKAELARSWKVSHQYISRLVARGCPLTNFEDANQWRIANASSRPPTHPKRIAQILEDEDGPEARAARKAYYDNRIEGARPVPSGDSLDGALQNATYANDEAFRLLEESMALRQDKLISTRLGVFNKSSENRFKAEQAYREEQERRSILIEMTKAQDWARKAFEVILSRLGALPQNLAVRCNPQNPHTAMDALEEEVKTIIADGQKAIAV